jgi:hypothetical protein
VPEGAAAEPGASQLDAEGEAELRHRAFQAQAARRDVDPHHGQPMLMREGFHLRDIGRISAIAP